MEELLLSEFDAWQKLQMDITLFLAERSATNSSVLLEFSFADDGSQFTLSCTKESDSSICFSLRSHSKSLESWAQLFKSYIEDKRHQIKLGAVLSKAVDLYRDRRNIARTSHAADPSPSTSQHVSTLLAMEDSDFEDSVDEEDIDEMINEGSADPLYSDDGGMDEVNFTTDFEIKMELKKKQWMKKNIERRERTEKETEEERKRADAEEIKHYPLTKKFKRSVIVVEETVSVGKQIFEHAAATFQILCNEMISLLKNGEEEGFLCEAIDDNLYHWSVKIQLFPEDSNLFQELQILREKFGYSYIELQLEFLTDFPFYPPLLRVVRPRFKGSLVQSLANIDLLKLSFWNPTKSVFEVLRQIKDIITCHARIDLNSTRNSIQDFPEGAHLPLEDYLVKLALATEVRPRANYELLPLANLQKAPQLKAKEKPKDKHGKGAGWAPGTGYGTGHLDRNGWNPDAYVKGQNEKDRQIRHVLSNIVNELRLLSPVPDDKSDEMFVVVEGSALVPYLETQLNVASFVEVGRHVDLYLIVTDVLEQLGSIQYLAPLLYNIPNPQRSLCLMEQLEKLYKSASVYIERLERLKITVACSKDHPDIVDAEKELAERICRVYQKLVQQVTALGGMPTVSEIKDVIETNQQEETLETRYKRLLKPLQYVTISSIDTNSASPYCHKYSKNAADKIQSEIRAIVKEWTALQTSLPLELASSIFVVTAESQVNLMTVMITGPEDTPYMNGCFLFDVCFPVTYPRIPPMVTLRTTGNNQVRFNPNLYNCGKVCLSLLGTWSGDKGERWNEKTSTLLQVLISIQSLILVPEPYFNEPGFESTMGTEQGQKLSAQYAKDIRVHCVHWAMLDVFRNPHPAFRDTIYLHFFLKKDQIVQQLDKWVSEDVQNAELLKNVQALKTELNERLKNVTAT